MIDALLRVARSKGPVASVADADAISSPGAPKKAVRRREAQMSDFTRVAALKTRSGLSSDSLENWKRLWQDNPAILQAKQPLAMGWVQEADGEIVGYLGSIPLLYQYGEQTLLAVAATCYAANPSYRAMSVSLVGSFFRQTGCDFFLDTTATPAAGRVLSGFKALPLPQAHYEEVLFWVLDSNSFVQAALNKLQVSNVVGRAAALLGSPALRLDIAVRARRPRPSSRRLSCRVMRIDEIGDEFGDLWLRKVRERPRLLACRTPEILRWHFLIPHSRRKAQVLGCYHEGRLVGYLILQTGLKGPFGLRRAVVADLIAVGGESDVVAELLTGAYELAKAEGSDVLEVLGFPEEVRSICATGRPYRRRYPDCPFYYKTGDPGMHDILAQADSWYACPFDGDATLSA